MRTRAFHGTSTTVLDAIRGHGLVPEPETRIFGDLLDCDWDRGSSKSLFGVYLAVSPLQSMSYAVEAARVRGGEPLLIQAEVDDEAALPDEDSIIMSLVAKEVMEDLGYGTDSDDRARVRARMLRDARFRNEMADALVCYGHEWCFRSPSTLEPDRALLLEAMASWLDRSLVHLSDNEAVMGLLGAQAKRLPFPVPASKADIAAQEIRHLAIKDRLCHVYCHLAREPGFRMGPRKTARRRIRRFGSAPGMRTPMVPTSWC